MSKKRSEQKAESVAHAPGNTGRFALTLEEFCQRLSAHDQRVELVGAFYAMASRRGPHKDSEDNFRARYEAFIKTPA